MPPTYRRSSFDYAGEGDHALSAAFFPPTRSREANTIFKAASRNTRLPRGSSRLSNEDPARLVIQSSAIPQHPSLAMPHHTSTSFVSAPGCQRLGHTSRSSGWRYSWTHGRRFPPSRAWPYPPTLRPTPSLPIPGPLPRITQLHRLAQCYLYVPVFIVALLTNVHGL